MAITIVTRAGKGAPLNATEHDANLTNLAAATENTSTGHDHDGTDSKPITAGNVTNTPAGGISSVTVQAAINELDSEKAPLAGTSAASWKINTGGSEADIQTTGLTDDRDFTLPDIDTMLVGAVVEVPNSFEIIAY